MVIKVDLAGSGMTRVLLIALCCCAVGLLGACGDDETDSTSSAASKSTDAPLVLGAASDLRPAFDELGPLYKEQTGQEVKFNYGSSGQLSQQIINGAPFDLFASADISFVDAVIEAGKGQADTKKTYAFGRLTVWSPKGAKSYTDVGQLENVKRVAIANPEHAPYGRAAQQALEKAGVYTKIKSRLVLGENIADTQRLAQSGNADVALIALSLAKASDGTWTLVPESDHKPLEQALVVTAKGERATQAKRFVDLVSSPEGRKIMTKYGFLLPGDTAPESSA